MKKRSKRRKSRLLYKLPFYLLCVMCLGWYALLSQADETVVYKVKDRDKPLKTVLPIIPDRKSVV